MSAEIDLTPTATLLEIAQEGNRPIPARSWGSPADCSAGALLVHGLGAHSGWFEAFGRQLKSRRIFALAYDQVGFGKRRQEKFQGPQQWYNDLALSFAHLKKMIGDKPIYLMGNSMGAAVALKVLADGRVAPAGFVMFSPGFDGHPQTFNLAYRLGAITRAVLRPDEEIPLPYTVDMVTRTESVRKFISEDPDRRFEPTGRMLLGVLKMSIDLKKVHAITCPLLFFCAEIDRIVDVKLGESMYQKLKTPSKQRHHFKEAWHDLMFDPVLDEIADEIASWVSTTADLQPEKQR